MTKKKKILIFILIIVLIGIFAYTSVLSSKWKLKELTEEEKIEDFRYMYDIMKENYPHFYSIEKMYGYDWLGHKEEFEKEIRETKDNMEFFHTLNAILMNKLHDPHTGVFVPTGYKEFLDTIKQYKLADETFGSYKKMFKRSENKYKDWDEIFAKTYLDNYVKIDDIETNIYSRNIIDTQILEQNKIAYLKVSSFSIDCSYGQKMYNKEKEEIIDFLKNVKHYPYLIIDISGNGGGSSIYWLETIIDPLLNQELSEVKYENICIVRGGDYSMKYFEKAHPDIRENKIEKLKCYSSMPKEVKENFQYYRIDKVDNSVLPSRNPIGFSGKIFLIIDENVFSAADEFAMFCKQSGFATLVGCNTKGSGGNGTMFIGLPNSGLIVRAELEMLLNEDGTSHFETGTVPDIEIEKDDVGDYNIKVMKEIINMIHSEETEK